MKRILYGAIIGLTVAFNADAVSEPENTELMPLFQADDTLEGMEERGWMVRRALLRNYEKHLIKKYAVLNLTEDELHIRVRVLHETRPQAPEIEQEIRELLEFPIVWNRIMREGTPNPCGDVAVGLPWTPEYLMRFNEKDLYDSLQNIRSVLRNERFKQRSDPEYETPEKEKNLAKFNDEQRELLNRAITTWEIPAKDPGLPFCHSLRLSDEDKAFIEDVVKDNPAVKLPWRDPEHFARLEREKQERERQEELLRQEALRTLGENDRYVYLVSEIVRLNAEIEVINQQHAKELNEKFPPKPRLPTREEQNEYYRFRESLISQTEYKTLVNTRHKLSLEHYIMEEDTIKQLRTNKASTVVTLSEDEGYAEIRKEHERLMQVMHALSEEYAHSLLAKYADWNLTREEREQRVQELTAGNAEEQREAKELSDYGTALYDATRSPGEYHMDCIILDPGTEEFRELMLTIRVLMDTICSKQYAGVDVRNGEVRIVSQTGDTVKTNAPTSVFQIPPSVIARRQEPESVKQERLSNAIRKLVKEQVEAFEHKMAVSHENEADASHYEARKLSEEEQYAIGHEYGRLMKVLDAIRESPQHEDIDEIVRAMMMISNFGRQRQNPVIARLDNDLNIIWEQLVDVRDGEIRLPPATQETRELCDTLFNLMKLPELTDKEIKTIKQIARAINAMAKTNTPTSVFQMPKGE